MKFTASIQVMPHKELLDPQGKTIGKNLKNMDLQGIENVRIGKHIELTVDADSEADARAKITTACSKLLANPIMEYFEFTVN